MLGIKKNDLVMVLAGKNRGKSGKVLKVVPSKGRAIVQSVNFVKKHRKRRKQQDQSGIIEQEASIAISNLNIMCKRCNKPTRIGTDVLKDGSKIRFCRKCDEVL